MFKRIVGLLSAAALLFALVPAVPLAAETGEDRDLIIIDTIEILGFMPPEWGEAPNYNIYVPDGVHYYIDYTNWFWYIPGVDAGMMHDGDVCDGPDTLYYQEFEIWPEEGYTFADDVTVLINGSEELVDRCLWSFSSPYFLVDTVDFSVTPPSGIPGDIDQNGEVQVSDAILAMRFAMGLTSLSEEQLSLADIDGSGGVNTADAVMILRRAMGLN